MNPKILIAFAGGVVLATGVTYFALSGNRQEKTTPQPAQVAQTAPVEAEKPAPAAEAVTPAPAAEAVTPAPQPEPEPEPTRVATARPERSRVTRAQAAKPARRPQTSSAPEVVAKPAPSPSPTSSAPSLPQTADAQPTGQPKMPEQPGPAQPADPPVRETLPPTSQIKQTPPAPRTPNTVTIPQGTLVTVRVMETISSDKNMAGDSFSATLAEPVVVDGFVIAERGSRAQGAIVEVVPAGRVKGVASLALELTEFRTADGQTVRVNTARFSKQGESSKKSDAAKVGVGAAIGAAIGAIAGGGKGAGVGAASGGAAGAGVVLATRGKAAEVPVETRVSFRLEQPVTITERLSR